MALSLSRLFGEAAALNDLLLGGVVEVSGSRFQALQAFSVLGLRVSGLGFRV